MSSGDDPNDVIKGIRLAVDNAAEQYDPLPADPPRAGTPAAQDSAPPAKTDGGGRRSGADLEGLPPDELPPDCPVTPLGVAGDKYIFLDQLHQIRILPAKDLGQANITSLFGVRADQLWNAWPRYGKDGEVLGVAAHKAARALMVNAARAGVYDVADRVRGRGTWLGEDGQLVIHAGSAVWLSDGNGWSTPGEYGRHVYPAAPPIARHLGNKAADGDGGPAGEVLDTLATWNWKRGELDAWLLLGWIGAAMVAGALRHRPLVWLTGDKATGKSTLHELIRGVFADALVSAADVTSAGLYQKLGHDCLPVAVDELEAEVDNHRAQNVIKLARNAATGAVILRGGADHHGQEFTARSCFLFSSILLPPLLPQDRSRLAILDLKPLASGDPPDLAPQRLAALGAQLRRRMVDQWPRFGRTLEAYRFALSKEGHGGRGADQFGTLLACADLLMWDRETEPEYAAGWAAKLPASIEAGDAVADHESCVAHLLGSAIDPRGTGETVGQALWRAAGLDDTGHGIDDHDAASAANKRLETIGLRVMNNPWPDWPRGKWVAVASSHVALNRIFRDTHWAGRSGAAGVWAQSLLRVDGAMKAARTVRFGRAPSRAVMVPLQSLTGGEDE